jgi:chromate transport protein ChrA
MDYKSILAIVAVGIAFVSYIPYFRDIFTGKTKPHAFSWLVWGILNAIAFAGQIYDKGGAGAWAVGFTAFVMFIIFSLALYMGEKNIKSFDWLCLVGAGVALILWFATSGPLLSVILITVIDALGFFPTVRKSFSKPYEETLTTYILSTIKYLLVVVALHSYTVVTVLFPASLVLMNGLFVVMLVIRRKQTSR